MTRLQWAGALLLIFVVTWGACAAFTWLTGDYTLEARP